MNQVFLFHWVILYLYKIKKTTVGELMQIRIGTVAQEENTHIAPYYCFDKSCILCAH